MNNNRVGFIGGGNMTHAITAGLLASGVDASDILIAEPLAEQRESLSMDFPGTTITASNDAVAAAASCIVLAVKPQIMADVCRSLAAAVQETHPLIVSIAAGIRSKDVDDWLGGGLAVVRAMPNQPALLGLGVSGVFANQQSSIDQRQRASRILAAVGRVVAVERETDIDAVTAISGSGPAYFYLLIDMLESTARQLGLDEHSARTLAIETASGAAAVASATEDSMQTLIERVRSPGGTTAAALDSLESDNVRDIFTRALTAARDRATVLAEQANG